MELEEVNRVINEYKYKFNELAQKRSQMAKELESKIFNDGIYVNVCENGVYITKELTNCLTFQNKNGGKIYKTLIDLEFAIEK